MAATIRNLAAFLLAAQALMAFVPRSSAYDFYVGGKDGWVQSPSETLNDWAARNRFQINDRLVFSYNKGEDSVLLVDKEDYDSCNGSTPIMRLDGGNSVFQLDRSGHLYFISGVQERCVKGEKMTVTVMSAKHGPKTTVSPPSPMAITPSLSPSPLPVSMPPSLSPSPLSMAMPPALAPSPLPMAMPPSMPPSAASSPSVGQSPSSNGVSAPAPAPMAMPPSMPPSSASSPSVSQSPSSNGVPAPAPVPMALPPSMPPSAAPSPSVVQSPSSDRVPAPAPAPMALTPSMPPSAVHSPSVVQPASIDGVPAPAPAPAALTGGSGRSSPGGLRVGVVSIVFVLYCVFHV